MNEVSIKEIKNDLLFNQNKTHVELRLVDVKTVNYGFMGFQQYEGVEPIVENKEG